MVAQISRLPSLDPSRVGIIEEFGGEIIPLEPIGAQVSGVDLSSDIPPPADVVDALEHEMAVRGFLVFKNEKQLGAEDFLRASCWWGGKELHSTYGGHPATPGGNRHIFRLSNDRHHGIPGVGPQWHNDGSFNSDTFSHSGYHIIRPAERGGGTYFAHQGAAHDALTEEQKERYLQPMIDGRFFGSAWTSSAVIIVENFVAPASASQWKLRRMANKIWSSTMSALTSVATT